MTNSTLLGGILSDPKKFVEEVANLDPTAVQNIISLLEGLLSASETSEADLVAALATKTEEAVQTALAVADAENAVSAAEGEVANAEGEVTDAENVVNHKKTVVIDKKGILSNKQADLAAAKDTHNAKLSEKALAQDEHDKQKPGFDNEQEVLRNVIEMLGGLVGGATVCPNGNGPADTAGWKLVRRVKAGNTWHPAQDQLRGSAVYGTFVDDPQSDTTFSREYDNEDFNQFLFISGDCTHWLICTKDAAIGSWYANNLRDIISSDKNSSPYQARWYHRNGALEDPWISTSDHGPAIGAGEIVYGENNFGHTHATAALPMHNGANVYIRQA